jgi:hypothetical protein
MRSHVNKTVSNSLLDQTKWHFYFVVWCCNLICVNQSFIHIKYDRLSIYKIISQLLSFSYGILKSAGFGFAMRHALENSLKVIIEL